MSRKRIVVIGAGFGGLEFCKRMAGEPVEILLIDRRNHHLFQPLLYQVATAGLAAPDIAQPIREILARQANVHVRLAEVARIIPGSRTIHLEGREEGIVYDYLVFAAGAVNNYFGNLHWEQFAPGLKSLEEARRIRQDILLSYELAESSEDPEAVRKLMTSVVIGGGPTGMEMAGALAELSRNVLRRDFRRIDSRTARVILIERSPRVLEHLPVELSGLALKQLKELGVEVMLGESVLDIREGTVVMKDREIPAATIVWTAGVAANPLTAQLDAPLDRGGRVQVLGDLSVPGHPELFVIGDAAHVKDRDGKMVPGVSPAAIQMGRHVARIIGSELWPGGGGGEGERPSFRYFDKGTMATIGRSRAVVWVGNVKFGGYLAWLVWLFVHLFFLVGLRNKVVVFVNWTFAYMTYRRGARLITGLHREG